MIEYLGIKQRKHCMKPNLQNYLSVSDVNHNLYKQVIEVPCFFASVANVALVGYNHLFFEQRIDLIRHVWGLNNKMILSRAVGFINWIPVSKQSFNPESSIERMSEYFQCCL